MEAEGERHGPVIEPDRVLATYRHVRERWGLKNADTARMKAKRAGWAQLPKNNPAEVTRLTIPREQWDAVGDQSPGTGVAVPREQASGSGTGNKEGNGLSPPEASSSSGPAAGVAAILAKLAERDAAELREARMTADQLRGEVMDLRERVGRAEAERDGAEQRARELEAAHSRAERRAEALQAELTAWTAGGPIVRAVRALLLRR